MKSLDTNYHLDFRGNNWPSLAVHVCLRESKGTTIMNTLNNANHAAASSHKNTKKSFSVYLAGDLWTHKDLIGNALLGDYIKKVSRGRYECVLPQDLEEPVHRTVDIRNVDLKHVMMCDMAIFNFDGSNLDSGTVVEFIYAKMIDVPCVILRTDFRASGEGAEGQDPWNLMASHWPRSKVVKLHGMAEYQGAKAGSLGKTIETFTIRQRNMANLYHEISDFVGIITPLRRRFEPGKLPADVYADLKEVEAEIYRLRSSFARWRDNPSQKLGRKMSDAQARWLKIALTVSRIAHNARYACQQLGMSFWGRGGPITIEPWTPPTHLS